MASRKKKMVFKGGWEASGMWEWVKKERSEEPKIQRKQGSRTSALLTWIASVCSPDKKMFVKKKSLF